MTGGERYVYLIRHGHVETGPEKRYIGWTDLPLSPAGLAQAEALGRFFSKIGLTRIVSSDLERARQTARALAGDGLIPVAEDPAFREIHLGEWENRTFSEIRRRYPEESARRDRDPVRHRPPGGESFEDLRDRVVPAFRRALTNSDGTLCVVTHIGVIRVLLVHLLGAPLDGLFRLRQDFGAFSRLNVSPSGIILSALNQKP